MQQKNMQRVYLRRRITVLAGLIAVLIVLVMIFAGPSTVASWFGAGPAAPSGEIVKPDTGAGGEEEDTEAPKAPGPCEPGDLAVEAVTDEVEYASGVNPALSLRVTNHSEVACDADLGTATMIFEVKSGSELYWSSAHCQTGASKNLVRMQPDQTLESEVVIWDRTRSAPDTCDEERESAPADGASYHLTVEVGGVQSVNSKQFLLY